MTKLGNFSMIEHTLKMTDLLKTPNVNSLCHLTSHAVFNKALIASKASGAGEAGKVS